MSQQNNKRSQKTLEQLGGRVPPQDLEAEKAVLGAIMLEKEVVFQIGHLLRPELFYFEEHQIVYRAIEKLVSEQQPVDALTVANQIKKNGDSQIVGVAKLIMEMTRRVSSVIHAEIHARILTEKWIRRQLIQQGGTLVYDCYDDSKDPFDLLADSEKIISQTNDHITGNDETTTEHTVNHVLELLTKKKEDNLQDGILPSGLTEIDQRMAGWVAPDLTIVGARPGMGKSTMAYTTIRNLCEQGIPVGMVSLEVNTDQVVQKLISLVSRVPFWKFRKKHLITTEEWVRIYEAATKIKKWPLYLDQTCDTISRFRLKAASWKRKFGVQKIILDYVQLMNGGGRSGANRDSDLGEVSRGLKKSCRELNISIMALAQLSRAVESRSDKMPQLSDLRESGSLEQDADNVMFLMRPEYYGFEEFSSFDNETELWDVKGLCVVNNAKSRHGDVGYFPLAFNGAISEFSDSKYTRKEESNIQIPLGFEAKSNEQRVDSFENSPTEDVF